MRSKRRSSDIIDWLVQIFNRCMEAGAVLKEWKVVCITPVYKGSVKITGNHYIKYTWDDK